MSCRTYFVFLISSLCILVIVHGAEDTKCAPHDLTQITCQENEVCVANGNYSGVCHCRVGYTRNKSDCVPPVPSTPSSAEKSPTSSPEHAGIVRHSSVSTGAITAAVIVPLMLAIGGVLILIGRRNHWFERLQILQGRRYEEVRIGQEDDEDDDPPLA